jgi:NAD-dependent dihydropyrimidine dehydrogenase PreA subunit
VIDSLDEQKCNGCEICFNVCPCDVFRLSSGAPGVRIAYPEDCQTCFACELDCPEGAIYVGPMRKTRLQAW